MTEIQSVCADSRIQVYITAELHTFLTIQHAKEKQTRLRIFSYANTNIKNVHIDICKPFQGRVTAVQTLARSANINKKMNSDNATVI